MPQRMKIDSHEWVVQKEGTITSLSSAVNLSASFTSLGKPPVAAILQAQGQNVRFTVDGTSPTATTGIRLLVDDAIRFHEPSEIQDCKLIEEAASATVHYVFYAERDR